MPSDKVVERAKRLTAVGAAIFMLGALVASAWTVATRTYAFAQRVEVYVGLPEWLGKVEKKIDVVAEEQRATNSRLDAWMRRESRRRGEGVDQNGRR